MDPQCPVCGASYEDLTSDIPLHPAGSSELFEHGQTIPEVLSSLGNVEAALLLINVQAIIARNFGEVSPDPKLLTPAGLACYVAAEMLSQVNNGGFQQFFDNSGEYSYHLVPALELIGSREYLDIAKRAVDIFGNNVNLDYKARLEHIAALTDEYENDPWEECNSDFYNCEEPVEELALRYLQENFAEG